MSAAHAGLLEIAQAIGAEPGFRRLLEIFTRKAAVSCGGDRCSLYLWRDGLLFPAMSQYASGHPNPEMWKVFTTMGPLRLADVKGFERAVRERRPVVIDDPSRSDLLPRSWVETFGIRAGLVCPLTRRGRLIGILHLNNCESSRTFGAADVELARAIAAQVALVIDNARLRARTRSRRRAAETLRRRVQAAHALHDRLSQTIFSVGLNLEWCLHHVAPDSPLHERLHELRRETRSIVRQMRHLVYDLSPEGSPAASLPSRVNALLEDFRDLTGIAVRYVERGDLSTLDGPGQDVLFKTLQEGLATIARRGCARRVELTLEVRDGGVAFELVDDDAGRRRGTIPAAPRAG